MCKLIILASYSIKVKKIITVAGLILITSKSFTQNIFVYKDSYKKLKTFKGDTLKYLLENFIERKDQYINKPFDFFMKDLEIPIKSYTPITTYYYKLLSKGDYLYFISYKEQEFDWATFKDLPTIIVEWDAIQADSIYTMSKRNNSAWTDNEIIFHRKLIIKNLLLVNHYSWRFINDCPGFSEVYDLAQQKSLYNTSRITYELPNGIKYSLSIYNPSQVDAFCFNYPNRKLLNRTTSIIDYNTEIGLAYQNALNYFQNNNFDSTEAFKNGFTAYYLNTGNINPQAQALAYILKKYKIGIELLKVGPDGKYHGVYDNKWKAP